MDTPLSKYEIIRIIQADKEFLKENFGVTDIGIFGSYAKDQQVPDSDIDFLVDFEEPRFDWIASLQIYLEKKFNKRIELVRRNNLAGTRFLARIEQEILYA